METAATMDVVQQPAWLRRCRLLLAVLVVWAGFHFLVTPLRPAGPMQPPVLLSGPATLLSALCAVALFIIGGRLGAWLSGQNTTLERFCVAGLALALWATPGGTIDDWLRIQHPTPGPPTAGPYLSLLPDYLLLFLGVLGLSWGGLREAVPRPTAQSERRTVPSLATVLSHGYILLLVLLFMTVALLFLMGPRLAATYRGQVYFAVLASGWLGIHGLLWTGLATPQAVLRSGPLLAFVPIGLGLLGLLAAAFWPALALAAPYNQLDTIPAWALVRPLPVEMVGLGTAALALTLRSLARKTAT